jgi:hypothetical protein
MPSASVVAMLMQPMLMCCMRRMLQEQAFQDNLELQGRQIIGAAADWQICAGTM